MPFSTSNPDWFSLFCSSKGSRRTSDGCTALASSVESAAPTTAFRELCLRTARSNLALGDLCSRDHRHHTSVATSAEKSTISNLSKARCPSHSGKGFDWSHCPPRSLQCNAVPSAYSWQFLFSQLRPQPCATRGHKDGRTKPPES